MKYRTRSEVDALTLGQILDELTALKIDPAGHTIFPTDVKDTDGVPSVTDALPAYLTAGQKDWCRVHGSVDLTFAQQVEQQTSLALWRIQIFAHGVANYVASLGLSKCMRELKARKIEMSAWEQRTANRKDVEKALYHAISTELPKATAELPKAITKHEKTTTLTTKGPTA